MFTPEQTNEISRLALNAGLQPAVLLAVCEIESGGKLFAKVAGENEPLIRFEGHYFYRLLSAQKRNLAIVEGLADQRAGAIANARTQAGRWKMLNRAAKIDRNAAMQSTSWGVGQVMGIHWQWLGYASVDHLVDRTRLGLSGQVELMLRYIKRAGLKSTLDGLDFMAFARGYNGPGFAKNQYHLKLRKAYGKYQTSKGAGETLSSKRHQRLVLQLGSSGNLVSDLQASLRRRGMSLIQDGDFGPATLKAVKAFQEAYGLEVDGKVGPATFEALQRLGSVA